VWSFLGSLAGALISAAVALTVWRRQALGKRRTEIAEEALVAFAFGVDAIAAVRSPVTFSHEAEALRKERQTQTGERLPGETFLVVLWRIKQSEDRFAPLRKHQLLCDYHFGADAAAAFAILNDVLHQVALSARQMASVGTEPEDESLRELRRNERWEQKIWAGYATPDVLAERLVKAKHSLEVALAPALRWDADPWFLS